MAGFELQGATYTKFTDIDVIGEFTGQNLADSIAPYLKDHRDQLLLESKRSIPHVMASTSVSTPLNSSDHWQAAQVVLKEALGSELLFFTNAYECASWGYILRLLSNQYPVGSSVMVSILDVNLRSFSFWENSDQWGKSGWGLCSFRIKLGDTGLRVCERVKENALADFCMNIKRISKGDPSRVVSLPFFPEQTRKLNDRILKDCLRLPDLHEDFGHCFGSDPWIGLIKNSQALNGHVLLSSFALSGYWSLLEVSISSECEFYFNESQFDFKSSVRGIDLTIGDESIKVSDYQSRGKFIPSLNRDLPLTTVKDFESAISIENESPVLVVSSDANNELREKISALSEKSKLVDVRIPAPSLIPLSNEFLSKDVFCSATNLLGLSIPGSSQLNIAMYQPYVDELSQNTKLEY